MEPPLATKLPELVRDSRLETTLSGDTTVHVYYDRPGRRAEPQREEWKQERLIGCGGNGVVWLEKRLAASSERGGGGQAHFRAVKQITSARSRSVLEICKSELEALAKFSTRKYKRCFVQSFGWYEGSGFLSIAMEYCPLGDLQQLLIEWTRPPESDTREIIGQVVQGLQFMHEEGFAHRDIKPGNILIMSRPPEYDWWVKIGDMGLSKRIEEVGAVTTSLKGTPGFFAPEQLGLGGINPKMADPFKSDIWCLGEMTFRMLCGEAVFLSDNDLRRYHQGTVAFPSQRLYEIEVSERAISFVASAMLAEPQSRLDAHQAFNHEWLGIVHNDSTVKQTDPSHPILGPSCSESNGGPYLGTEASGAWSTMSLPLRPPEAESTIRSINIEGHRNSKVSPRLSFTHYGADYGDSDSETPGASQTIRQTTIQEIRSIIDTKDHNHNPRSSSRAGTQPKTSRRDENSNIHCCNREESCSPNPATTATADPPTIHDPEGENAKEEGINDRCIEEETKESMAKLLEIRHYFDNKVQPRSLYYLNGAIRNRQHRAAEYQWLRNAAMCDILLKADEINTHGNVELRAKKRKLLHRVNAILDDLETATREFDGRECDGEQKTATTQEHSPSTEEGSDLSPSSESSESSDDNVVYDPREWSDDDDVYEPRGGYSRRMEDAIRYLTRDTSRDVPFLQRHHDSVSAKAGSSRGNSTSKPQLDMGYEPPPRRKSRFTDPTQDAKLKIRRTTSKHSLIDDNIYGQPLLTTPKRPPATTNGKTGKLPGVGLSFSRIQDWILNIEDPYLVK
ncbi:kinase-like domain-containing protein [Xylaria scruposa]|nr:kinase-like domain-containing protein [Xylaria scruposa]